WLRFTADGSALLFHGGYREQCECVVWDVRTGRDRFRLRAGSDDTFAPSPDGSRLARGTPAGVFVLDAATGDEVLALRDAAGPVAWGGGGRPRGPPAGPVLGRPGPATVRRRLDPEPAGRPGRAGPGTSRSSTRRTGPPPS